MKIGAAIVALLLSLSAWSGTEKASIYQLQVALTNQENNAIEFDEYRGLPTLVTMFYGSCPNVCPLLFETMQRMENSLNARQKRHLRVLMISIDPERDTPQALAALAKAHHADLARWTLARATASDVRKIAAVLNVQYRRLPNGDFNHSSIINLIDKDGAIAASTSKLGSPDPQFMEALAKLTD
jgi:protein SCO1